MLIGFLGERETYGWWQSSFFSRSSDVFFAPLFGRTQRLAQYYGVTRAATLAHDDSIGVGSVYHLFRLPEDMEQALHRAFQTPIPTNPIALLTTDREAALAWIRAEADLPSSPRVGPTRAGNVQDLMTPAAWRAALGQYALAFEQNFKVFPYFADQA